MRRKIARKLGANKRPYRNMIAYLREEAMYAKNKIKEKYSMKLEHLKKKQKEKDENHLEEEVPDDLIEFEDLKVFDKVEYEKIVAETYDIKVIGDLIITEDEKNAARLPPKFCVEEDLYLSLIHI